jgi:hypothetical protein
MLPQVNSCNDEIDSQGNCEMSELSVIVKMGHA